MSDNRNLVLAVILSIGVFVGWHFLVERPRQLAMIAQREALAAVEAAKPADAAATKPGSAPSLKPVEPSRDDMLAHAPRIAIDTPKVQGSISLAGARIDDLKLVHYRETVDPKSPAIVLLNPKGGANSYYAEFGWVGGGDSANAALDPDAAWTQIGTGDLTVEHPISLRHVTSGGIIYTRTISIDADYLFTITDRLENPTDGAQTLFPYGRLARLGTPPSSDNYLIFEGLIGALDGHLDEIKYKDIISQGRAERKSTGGWLGVCDKYWLTALMPSQDEALTATFNHAKIGTEDLYQTDFLGSARALAPGQSVEMTNHLFAGAKEINVLDRYESSQKVVLFDRAIDWGWFYFLTKPIFKALDLIYGLVGNFGVSILILTVIVKALFFPLANRAAESSTKMKKVQPEMQKLQERYKDDRQKMQQEIMELYQREKVNPISGCLPLLLQIPVFFSLYKVLYVSIEMRHAPFFGWITDLSAPDPAWIITGFGLLPFTPPEFLQLGVWPILMGLSMFVLQRLQPAPGDPVQQRVLMFMPLIIIFTMGRVPSGLAIYWTWSNLLSLLQQIMIMRRMGVPVELFNKAEAKS